MTEKEMAYDEIEVGAEFNVPPWTLTQEVIEKYLQAVGDDNPIYRDQKAAREAGVDWPIAPPTMAFIFSRTSVLLREAGKMPPGSIQVRQQFHFVCPFRPGDTLATKAKVVEKFTRKDRKWMIIDSNTVNQRGETTVTGRLTVIWP